MPKVCNTLSNCNYAMILLLTPKSMQQTIMLIIIVVLVVASERAAYPCNKMCQISKRLDQFALMPPRKSINSSHR